MAFLELIVIVAKLVSSPRTEPYGRVVVFEDIAGNRRDLLGDRIRP